MGIFVEDLLFVDPVVGIGERRQKRRGRKLQSKDYGRGIWRLDLVDHHEEALARTADPFGWIDNLVPARHHIIS